MERKKVLTGMIVGILMILFVLDVSARGVSIVGFSRVKPLDFEITKDGKLTLMLVNAEQFPVQINQIFINNTLYSTGCYAMIPPNAVIIPFPPNTTTIQATNCNLEKLTKDVRSDLYIRITYDLLTENETIIKVSEGHVHGLDAGYPYKKTSMEMMETEIGPIMIGISALLTLLSGIYYLKNRTRKHLKLLLLYILILFLWIILWQLSIFHVSG